MDKSLLDRIFDLDSFKGRLLLSLSLFIGTVPMCFLSFIKTISDILKERKPSVSNSYYGA